MDQGEQRLDFAKEVEEYITQKLVKSAEVLDNTQITAHLKIVTLEDVELLVECSTQKGLTVTEVKNAKMAETRFDSFEQLLNTYSHEYQKAFNEQVSEKLRKLQ